MKSTLLRHMYGIEDALERATWYVLVNKILYYRSELFPKWEPVNDDAYDQFELGYLHLCKTNEFVHKEYPEFPNMVPGMMEVDFTHPKVAQIFEFMKDCYK